MEGNHYGLDYNTEAFDVLSFANETWGPKAIKSLPLSKSTIDDIHTIFLKLDLPGNVTMLDFGCGPVINMVVSSSRLCSNITMADYSLKNIRYIMKWLKGEDMGFTWNHLYEYIGQKEGRPAEEIEKRSRAAVKEVLACDILKEDIFGVAYLPKFDVVTTSLCIEAAVTNIPTYHKAVAKLAEYVKPGGYIIMAGIFHPHDTTFYMVKHKAFYSFPYTKQDTTSALTAAGFENIEWYEHDFTKKCDIDQYKAYGHFCLIAKKNSKA